MSYKSKGQAEIVIILVAVVAILAIALAMGIFALPAMTIGSFSSISVVRLITPSEAQDENLPSGEYWWLQFIGDNPYADKLVGGKTAESLIYPTTGEKNRDAFELVVEPTTTPACTTQLATASGSQNMVYVITATDATFGWTECNTNPSAISTWCSSQVGGFYAVQKSSSAFDCVYRCYKKVFVQQLGVQVSETNINFNEKFTFTNQGTGKSTTATVSPTSLEVMLPNPDIPTQNIGKIRWIGNMFGNSVPCVYSFANVYPTYLTSIGWFFTDSVKVSSYQTQVSNLAEKVSQTKGYSDMELAVMNYNLASNSLGIRTTTPPYSTASTSGGATNGQVSFPLSHGTVLPTFNLIISKEFLPFIGIQQTYGIAEITYITNTQTVVQGGATTYSANIKNIGLYTGRFGLAVSCDSGVSALVNPTTTADIAPQASTQAQITVTGGSIGLKACTLTATSINAPTVKAIKIFNVDVIAQCYLTCGTNTHRNTDLHVCDCVCDLPQPYYWNADRTACFGTCPPASCTYGQNPTTCACNPPPCLSCTLPFVANQACTACVCGLLPEQAPTGKVLDTVQCKYVYKTCATGTTLCTDGTCKSDCGGGIPDWLFIVGGLIIVGGIIYLAVPNKK